MPAGRGADSKACRPSPQPHSTSSVSSVTLEQMIDSLKLAKDSRARIHSNEFVPVDGNQTLALLAFCCSRNAQTPGVNLPLGMLWRKADQITIAI